MLARRILVVEDSPTQAERIRLVLEGEGYQVEIANNGLKALEQIRNGPFDLILSDIVMPEMDGYALCEEVKSDPQTKWLPFVFLTERRSVADIIKGLELGGDNFIPKPFEDQYLLQRLRRIFENLELRSQGYSEMRVTLRLADRKVVITPDKQQMVELLFSNYEELCQLNARLNDYAKNLQIEVQQRTQQLREAEAKYRMLVEHIAAVTYLAAINAMEHMLYISPQVEPLLGFTVDQWLTTPNLWANQLHPEDRERVLAEYTQGIATQMGFSSEFRMLAQDRREVWIRAEAHVIMDDTGRSKYMQGIMLDITARKRAAEELQRQRDTLYQAEKIGTMGQLLAGVAHELNNPLAVVSAYTELLRSQMPSGPLAEEVEKVYQAAQRCVRIVKNFLALARQHPPERLQVQLNHIINEAIALLTYRLRVDGVEVTVDLVDDLPIIYADPNELQQVVVNLLTNADQALRQSPAPRQLTVSTSYDRVRSCVYLGVADTGPGIPSDLKRRIFEPFFTTKPAGQGTGLGLPLCQSIVEAHGGTIRVESTLGAGALFVIELPIGNVPADSPASPLSAQAVALLKGTLLIVDDEPGVAEVLAEVLAIDGHQVDTARNGVIALHKLEERSYDLILCDLRMPELDGPGLYAEIKRRDPALCQRIIFLTGDVLSPETQAFLAETTVPTVSKPFSLNEIRRITQEQLQLRLGQEDRGCARDAGSGGGRRRE